MGHSKICGESPWEKQRDCFLEGLRWERELRKLQSYPSEEKCKIKCVPRVRCNLVLRVPGGGGEGQGWVGWLGYPGTRKFPELLLCIHGGGGCPLLYWTLSLPLQFLNCQPEPGVGGEGRRGVGFQGQ